MVKVVTKSRSESYPINRFTRWEAWMANYAVGHWDRGKKVTLGTADTLHTNVVTTHQPENWNYKYRLRNHQNATTYLYGDGFKLTYGSMLAEARFTGYLNSTYPNYPCYSRYIGSPQMRGYPENPSNLSVTDADHKARMRLMKDLADKRRAFQGMTFVGELSKTIQGLRNPAQAFRRSLDDWINSAKKQNPKRGLDNLNRALSGSWLEYVYGISPLIGDLENAKEALARTLDRYENLYQRFSSVGEAEKIHVGDYLWAYGNDEDWMFRYRTREYKQATVKYYGQVYTAAILGNSVAQRQNLGFTLRDFAPTVWELIPYSFVIDYFSNIGDLIEACSTYTGDVAWISKGILKRSWSDTWLEKNTNFCSNFTNFWYAYLSKDHRLVISCTKPFTIERRQVERIGLAGVPVVDPFRDFRLEIPGAGSTKWINLSALVASSRGVERFLRGIS